MTNDLLEHLIEALVYALLGIVVFVLAFIALDRMTPGSLWKEIIDEHNTALAIVVGSISVGISIVIAAAIW
ncbi:MAG TPA: DUF350 domain-containing protein [Longimicrobium sp.]|nr:DUF350 domain-containing protein [Longimicrobium sp.]